MAFQQLEPNRPRGAEIGALSARLRALLGVLLGAKRQQTFAPPIDWRAQYRCRWLPLSLTIAALAALAGTIAASHSAQAGVFGTAYQETGRCGGFPRVSAETPEWACIGIVAGPDQGLQMPRNIVEVAPGRFLITDMVGWGRPNGGRLLELSFGSNGRAEVKRLLTGLNYPHGLAIGPDGAVYLGEETKVSRFSLDDPAKTREVLIDNLPSKAEWQKRYGFDHLHSLSHIMFDGEGNLIVNLGAASDRCERPVKGRKFSYPCAVDTERSREAALWLLRFDKQRRPAGFEPLARGLRNTIGMALHEPSGTIVQAENNIDGWGGKNPELPPDELNIIRPGVHYGWPYCVGRGLLHPDYRGKGVTCSKYQAASVELPAHAAPMGMLYYSGPMFPELAGKLLMNYHGFADHAQRIAIYDSGPDGAPVAPPPRSNGYPGFPPLLLERWQARDGLRPKGRPSGLTQAGDGSLWFTDYSNKSIMAVFRKTP